MHVLLTLAGVIGAFGYWFFIIRRASKAAGEIVEAAGRARGAYRRRRFRNRAESSRIEAIDDPRAAAAVVVHAIAAQNGALSAAQDAVLRQAMTDVMEIADPDEFIVFARWVMEGGYEANNVSLRLSRQLNAMLTLDERAALVRIVRDVAAADGAMSDSQQSALRVLERRLALAV